MVDESKRIDNNFGITLAMVIRATSTKGIWASMVAACKEFEFPAKFCCVNATRYAYATGI